MKQRSGSKIVPLFLNGPPATIAAMQGFNIGINGALLNLSPELFARGNIVDKDDPLCRYLATLQKQVDDLCLANGFEQEERTETVSCDLRAEDAR